MIPIEKPAAFFIVMTALLMFFPVSAFAGHQPDLRNDPGYVSIFDITVSETKRGEMLILKIGRYGPFRRYSWFRGGDIIVEIDGVKANSFTINYISTVDTPWIKYRRGNKVLEVQISLERNSYSRPAYLNKH